ncbi:MAG TPA: hypothetical protein VM529_24985 [Gemmata sp.]|nr:hypothetical protein [Gemmata sp.]
MKKYGTLVLAVLAFALFGAEAFAGPIRDRIRQRRAARQAQYQAPAQYQYAAPAAYQAPQTAVRVYYIPGTSCPGGACPVQP